MMGDPPDFFVIGGTKCGTTSLYAWMEKHPGVVLAPKEGREYLKPPAERRFQWQGEGRRGDFSNGYTRDPVYPSPAEALAGDRPDARLLYLMRHPLKRIESHYRHRLVTGTEWRGPSRAVTADPAYLAASCYGHQIACFRQHFSAESLLVLRSEDLFERPKETLAKLCAHVGVGTAEHSLRPENRASKRKIMPLPLRMLVRWPRLHPKLRALSRSSLGEALGSVTADSRSFDLDAAARAELAKVLRDDLKVMEAQGYGALADWANDLNALDEDRQ